ncbi:MAG: hypothetical protein GC171_04245 [Terrimonas sp.]|nr:hypothetical protein [Terrimonas sp.]
MVDSVRLWIFDTETIACILKNPLLSFRGNICYKTGEVYEYPKEAKLSGLTFRLIKRSRHREVMEIRGSLHKWHNKGLHNYDDFSIREVFSAIYNLCRLFQINPFTASIHNLEFGVNIPWPNPASELIQNILSFKGQLPEYKGFNGGGSYIEFPCWEYRLKLYDKALQNRLTDNLLRVELSCHKQRSWQIKSEISVFADLLNPDKLQALLRLLLDKISGIILYDPSINLDALTKPERKVLTEGRLSSFWKEQKNNLENFKKKRSRFDTLVNNYGSINTKNFLSKSIVAKWNELQETDSNTRQSIDLFLSLFTKKTFPVFPDLPELDITHFHQLVIRGNNPFSTIRCQSCGRDISSQKPGSKFCSEKVFGKDAKRCRNKDSNPRNNLIAREKRRYGSTPLLFEIEPL